MNISIKGFNWEPVSAETNDINQIINKFGISEILARLLSTRDIGIERIDNFLNPTLRQNLPDPFHILDMEKAADIISDAIINNEKIVIFGDYDVDGATSSALLKRFFTMLKIEAEIYIPDRIEEGYGPNINAFASLKQNGANLIITVDCGTSSFEAINYGIESDLKIIIIDHHLSGDILPSAHAIVNPNRKDETTIYKSLAAVGVAFLAAIATTTKLRQKAFFQDKPEPELIKLLDIVAIGTICDVVPLDELNRTFVYQGLKILNKKENNAVKAFCNLLNIENCLTVYHLGYVIGPRINAGGRVGESSLGARLLSTEDLDEAIEIAKKLDHYNEERKAIEFIVYEQALEQARNQHNEDSLILVGG
ncbi:MAG: DHH family phosphoesterase, partial [Pseudomonadota bacterium]